jgi:SNF2 family DNA or RNA helicase
MIKLHKYQQKAVNFIKDKKKCALYLGMGLGKTSISLSAIDELLKEGSIAKVLIIAPKQVVNNVWPNEILKWDNFKHITYSIVIGSATDKLAALKKDVCVYITSRDNVIWLLENRAKHWDMVIIDESSSFKNATSKRFKYLRRFEYEYMVQLSGTPAPNGLLDIWSQMYLLDKGKRLGRTMSIYKQNYFISDYLGYKFTPKDPTAIHNLVSDITLSMQTCDYLDLPPRIDVVTKVDNPEITKYKKLEREYITMIQDCGIIAYNAATLVGKLLQFCNGAVYDKFKNTIHVHDAKLEALQGILDDNPNENIIVAYNFKSDLERLLLKFKDAVRLDESNETITRWNDGKIKLMLAHPASSGKGLNLQKGGNMIVWFGLTWNLEDYLQFNARLHRQGQEKPTIINHIVLKNTIDEKILTRLDDKNTTQESLFAALKNYK